MHGITIWLLAVVATGVGAGLLAIACNRLVKFTTKQRAWLPMWTAVAAWIGAGAIAQYGFRTNPWGWPGTWSNNFLANMVWLFVAQLISEWIFLVPKNFYGSRHCR